MNASTLRSRSFERILLIKPSALGDVIHTVPVLAKLRARYPAARIDWLLTPAIAELIRHHPALSNVVPFARRRFARWWSLSAAKELAALVRALRQPRYELVIDLHGQFRSALLCLASGAPCRIGFDRPRRQSRAASTRNLPATAYRHGWTGAREGSWLAYTHHICLPTLDVHAVDRYLWLGRLLGLDDDPADFHLPLPAEAEARVGGLLEQHGVRGRPYAVLVPGTMWETKHWTAEGFAGVGRHLCDSGRAVVLAGSAQERERCRAVAALCPGAVDLSGQTSLTELAALIRRAAVCVTNDSGSMHLTVALGRPVVSIFGPTDPLWVGPYGRPHAVVRADVACAPCYLRKLSRCPHDHACMRQVGASRAIECVEQALAPGRTGTWNTRRTDSPTSDA